MLSVMLRELGLCRNFRRPRVVFRKHSCYATTRNGGRNRWSIWASCLQHDWRWRATLWRPVKKCTTLCSEKCTRSHPRRHLVHPTRGSFQFGFRLIGQERQKCPSRAAGGPSGMTVDHIRLLLELGADTEGFSRMCFLPGLRFQATC